MWKTFFEVFFVVAVALAVGSLTSPKRISWWLAIPIFAFGLFALAMWLHDAAHVTFVGRRIDARRERKAAAEAAIRRAEFMAKAKVLQAKAKADMEARRNEIDRLLAIAKARADAEAEVDRYLWTAGHFHGTRGREWCVGLDLCPPSNVDPRQFRDWTAECIVWHAGTGYRSEPEGTVQGTLGIRFAFPQDFETELTPPLPAGHYEVEWVPKFDAPWTPDFFVIDEAGHFDIRQIRPRSPDDTSDADPQTGR
jgi:hypothetical protein